VKERALIFCACAGGCKARRSGRAERAVPKETSARTSWRDEVDCARPYRVTGEAQAATARRSYLRLSGLRDLVTDFAGCLVARRRLSLTMDLGSISHWPLPGRPGCFCLEPERRPRLSSRQTSALVVFMATAVC
jgi:hypothetical protein